MLEMFEYSFMVRAFIAGLAIGIAAPLIGFFLVAKRYALIADSLAHVSLAGVAIAVMIGIEPLVGALAIALVSALVIEKLRTSKRVTSDMALAIFLSSGLAVAVVLIGLANSINIDLMSYLFGSITTVTTQDLLIILPLTLAMFATVGLLYQKMTYTVFNEEQARASGLPTERLNLLLIILAAITVVVSLRIVGGLLIGALTVIPVAAAAQIARSMKQTIAYAIVIGVMSTCIGLTLSYYANLAAGGTIVLTTLVLFGVSVVAGKLGK
ncbi:metal ABC transporter permease [Candidatus Saccharibacteria bacterium]|nr:MAG: metal ABC transporter permease [Candidatus Saccharibacteria bacterium]